MKLTNTILLGFGAFLALSAILILRPVPIVAEEDSLVVHGVVDHIGIGGVQDVIIRLKDHSTVYYINRGYENGLDMKQLQEELLGKKVTLKYPEYWTPLDWNNSLRHISKLALGNKIIFNELK